MLGEAIKKRIEKRPFEPFVLHITGGDRVEVRHPEMAILTRYSVAVGHGGRDGIADYVLDYSLIHVVKIEPIHGPSGRGKNGNGHPKSKRPR